MKKTKAGKHEEKGDALSEKGKFNAALKHYRKAREAEPDNAEIYTKLIATHEKLKQKWTEKDFAETLAWSMKKQELENPKFKRIHAQMEPEWDAIMKLIRGLLETGDEKKENSIIEEIVAHGESALYPLIEMILSVKDIKKKFVQ